MAYKQLGENERFVIELMLSKNSSNTEIGNFLGYSRQTIMREIERNSRKDVVYSAVYAHNLSIARREYPRQDHKLKKLTDENLSLIVKMLRERSSP